MLKVIPTPIGNLEDITLRAIEELKRADYILAEDTRVTKTLLHHYNILTDLKPYHAHNEHKVLEQIIDDLKEKEKTIALVSDAGMPSVSDPGFLLVRACIEAGIDIEVLPGPSAFLVALVRSGFPSDRFVFEGFLPHKKGRLSRLKEILTETRTIVLYESTHRLMKFLQQFRELAGEERRLSVSRELTKKFEETRIGTATELIEYYEHHSTKGEFVICIKGKS